MPLLPMNEQSDSIAMAMSIKGIYAYDPETGSYLRKSMGRSGHGHKWFLFFADSFDPVTHEIRPYREFRHVFRCWDENDAIEVANKKLVRLISKNKAEVTRLFGNGERRE